MVPCKLNCHETKPGTRVLNSLWFLWSRLAALAWGFAFSLSVPANGESVALSNQWSIAIRSLSDSSPAVAQDGTIYFGTWNHNLWAVNPDGTRKWTFRAGLEIWSSPAVGADGTIYFGCRDRKFYAVGSEGHLKWSFPTGAWVDASPAIGSDGTLYFGSWDNYFYALNSDGSRKWRFATGGPIVSSPAVGTDGAIYFGSHDKNFYALGPDGQKKWAYATGGQVLSSPALNGDECLYVTSVDGFLYALNLDGSLRWKLKTGGVTQSSPVIGPDGLIFVGVNHELWNVTAEGKQKWTRGMGVDIEEAPTAFSDNTVFTLGRYGFSLDLDQERNVKWHIFLGPGGYASPGVEPGGTLFVPANLGEFWSLPNKVPLAKTYWPKFRGNPRNTGNVRDNVL